MPGDDTPLHASRDTPTTRIDLDWPYDDALATQLACASDVRAGGPMTLFVGSHREEVVTLGRHAPEAQLVARVALDARGVQVRRIERGGGATAHGPGQLVVYPIVSLARMDLTIVSLTCALLHGARRALLDLGVVATVSGERPGVFVTTSKGEAKLASIGFRVSDGVVTHGLALNFRNDLSLFDLIAPCGVRGQPVASVESLVDNPPDLVSFAHRLAAHTADELMVRSGRNRRGECSRGSDSVQGDGA